MSPMRSHQVRERIVEIGVIPVLRAKSPDEALEKARAICAGGIPIVEMTLTVPGAVDLIAELSRSMPDALIGAGTVLDAAAARRSIEAGAQYIVSPGLDPETIRCVKECHVLMIAGALTPTEVISAWRHGSDFVKIFPCANVGGPGYIKALKSALPHIRMIPTGGVNLANVDAFFAAGAEAVGVGGELTSAASVTQAARDFICAVKKARIPRSSA
jgi:2-dehydro-3-deoxyphosphogluconate aldolase/(4S)-4-hydroxy-2-oxoglutarate aldolase